LIEVGFGVLCGPVLDVRLGPGRARGAPAEEKTSAGSQPYRLCIRVSDRVACTILQLRGLIVIIVQLFCGNTKTPTSSAFSRAKADASRSADGPREDPHR
jgi:hypothetical protein